MTIELREWNLRLGLIERAAEMAPERTYEVAKNAAAAIAEAAEGIIRTFAEHDFPETALPLIELNPELETLRLNSRPPGRHDPLGDDDVPSYLR